MIRVDAHHHVWRLDRGEYPWLTPDMSIYRDFGLEDLRPLLDDIDATVLIQAAATDAETDDLLAIARDSNGLVRGVVGWVDFESPAAVARIEALAKNPLLKGLRPMRPDGGDIGWLFGETAASALKAMAAHGLCLDAPIEARHLPAFTRFANMYPDLKIVLDDAARPPIAAREFDSWADDLDRAARETNAFCKLSGLPAVAGEGWMMNDVRPYVDHIFDCFGPSRTMWGSGWPLVEMFTPYQRWRTICERFQFRFGLAERDEIMCGTAVRFYGLS